MSVVDYFEAPSFKEVNFPFLPEAMTLGRQLVSGDYDVAILGVKFDSGLVNKGSAVAPDEIRKYLYSLRGDMMEGLRIADLGNIKPGKTPADTYYALRDVVDMLRSKGVVPIVLGGSHELTESILCGLGECPKSLNMVVLDARLDLSTDECPAFAPYSFLNAAIKEERCFRIDVVGCQSYYYSSEQMDALKANDCWCIRLGTLRYDLQETEPIFRDADLVSVDMSVVRQSDAPGMEIPSPNGLTGEELCQLARYAGLSDRVQAFGLFEVNPYFDNNGQTASLAAQVVWHFLEAMAHRYGDYPLRDLSTYKKVVVAEMEGDDDMVFYNNHLNNRWWMEIPMERGKRIFACSYNDYDKAKNGQIPDLWMRYYKR